MIDWSEIKHFKPSEFAHADKMKWEIVVKLDLIRDLAGVPMVVTSSYRPGDDKSHGRGWAVDVSDNAEGKDVSSSWRYKVLKAAYQAGVRRLGVYDRHVHIDSDPTLPQGVCWWSTSKAGPPEPKHDDEVYTR